MRKHVFYFLLATMGLFMTSQSKAVNSTSTITWPFELGTANQIATYSDATGDYFKPDHVSVGNNLAYVGSNTTYGVTYTQFQPAAQLGAASADCMVGFNVWPKTGLSFVPSTISFDCMRYGTDGGSIDVVWRSSDGTATTLESGLKPARNNSGAGTHATYTLSALNIPVSTDECALEVYVYGLGATKQVGIANVVIEGNVTGEIITVKSFAVNTSVLPELAGVISSTPVGNEFDENTEVELLATRNFGYSFLHWEDASGATVSTENPYKFTLTEDVTLKAVYNTLNTYSLELNVEGGGNDYMVTPSPEGVMVEGVRMYEDGTSVTISAAVNPILTFTNWSSGETSADLIINMNEDKIVTANYSATDYIVAWDFYESGNSGRVADFFSADENQSSALVLRNEAGDNVSWLDKSLMAAGGYEGNPAAVNWNALADKYYYQISFDATDYTDIKVASAMLLNYNAYSVVNVEYSIDGNSFSPLGTITLSSAKVWYDNAVVLPAAADHASKVYVRWLPDYTSAVIGSSTDKDGSAISGIYVTATATINNDGTAPVLSNSVPSIDATGASATGKIVLTFDEKVKIANGVTATLGDKQLTPAISGKTITFAYSGLDYNSNYTFTLAGNTVSDLADNTLTTSISIPFTTLNRPVVTKQTFDFVVGIDGDFKAAIEAAKAVSNNGKRFYIFFPDGEYNIGETTGDGNQMSTISLPNVSYIGEHPDSVIVFNKSINESINSTATLYLTDASTNIYMQDLSLMNKMDYRTGNLKGRGVALWDQGNKNIYKNVKLLSNQDTYYTGNTRTYWENGEIHGTVDFICGGGDIFFNECLIYLEERGGNVVTAPATNGDWGYVFSNCTIDGFSVNNGGYRLGRPWSGAPKSVFLNTTMKVLPTAEAWGDPMNVVPAVFAEYNSLTSNGATVDLSNRRTSYTKDLVSVNLNPVLTKEKAAEYTIENVVGGDDVWQPKLYTEQAEAPVLSISGMELSWDNSDYVLCWAVFVNDNFLEFVTTNSYVILAETNNGASYSVRAANAMGGLSASSNKVKVGSDGVDATVYSSVIVEKQYYSIDGKRLASLDQTNGIVIVHTLYADGHIEVTKELSNNR